MKEHIEKIKKEACEVREFRSRFFDSLRTWYESGDCKDHPICEFGEYIDVFKDLCESEEKLAESCYFLSVVYAMHEAEEDDEKTEEWMRKNGYNPNHYKSSGRFAPSGRGIRMGYPWPFHLPNVIRSEPFMSGYPVYFDEGEHSGRGDIKTGYGENGKVYQDMNVDEDTMEHGRAYGRYREARRHYTESHDPEAKKDMTRHAMDHFGKTLETLTAIWKDVEPEMRKKMRSDLEKTVASMPV